jgi:hypothetical protein
MEEERMSKKIPSPHFANIVMLGAVWGFSEAALGLGLQKCASLASGSIMTAVAFFFISAAWVMTRRSSGVILAATLATLMKMFDAVLLSLPLRHGAVANPIFAFWTEALAFLVIFAIAKQTFSQKRSGQAIGGGLSAILAVSLFPLAKFVTGIPACVFPGTRIPLSLYYGPIALGLSLITVPLGFWVGNKVAAAQAEHPVLAQSRAFRYVASPVVLIICLLIMTVIRLAG